MPFPLPKDQLEANELELGTKLPPVYRSKMIKLNGGTLHADNDVWEVVPIANKESIKLLKRTFPGVIRKTQDNMTLEWFPKNALVIAENGTGDCLVILKNTNGQYEDKIWLWRFHGGQLEYMGEDVVELARS